jgi:hypothetical protein
VTALYLRSRRVGWIALLVVVAAALRRFLVPWSADPGPFTTTVSLTAVAATAAVIATGLASPCAEVERSAATLLPRLRGAQLLGTSALAAAGFTVAAASGGLSVGEYLRNLAGFIGIALLTGLVLGAHRSWTLPLGYVMLCAGEVDLGQYPLWAFPVLPAGNAAATGTAVALLAVGAVTVSVTGLPDR